MPRTSTEAGAKVKGRLIMVQKERELLKGSSILEDYPLLQRWIEEDVPFSKEWASTLPEADQRFLRDLLPEIITQASAEWRAIQNYPLQDMGLQRVPCTLCSTPNRWIYYLVNTRTGTHMNVGSECVKHFGIDVSASGKTARQLMKEATALRRSTDIDSEVPGIHKLVRTWLGVLEEYPVVVPTDLETPYRELGGRVHRLYDAFIETDKASPEQVIRDKEIVEQMKLLLEERRKLLSEMRQFVNDNIGRKFAVHREYINWLERTDQNAATAVDWLKEDRVITPRTIFRLFEPTFMNTLVPDLNRVLNPAGAQVRRVDAEKAGYIIGFGKRHKLHVRLFAKHYDLLLRCGEAVFGAPSNLTLGELLDLCTMADMESTYAVWGEFLPILQRHGIPVADVTTRFEDFDLYFSEAVIKENASDKYILVSISEVVEEFKSLAFGVGKKTVAQMVRVITDASNTRYSPIALRELYNERKERTRAMRGF